MDKVLILTSGSYSDKSIEGIFSSLDKIEEYKQQKRRIKLAYEREYNNDCTLEEIIGEENYNDPYEVTIDQEIIDASLFPYIVQIKENGDIHWCGINDYCSRKETYTISNPTYRERTEIALAVHCNARDKDHAIKIAGDKRRELIANNLL